MRRFLLLALVYVCAIGARADFNAPDFAYPQTVTKDAEAVLKSSTAQADGLRRLKAVMEITVAKSAVDPDSLFTAPSFISRIAAGEKSIEAKGLMLLYQAQTLYNIYERARWRYDRVQAPAEPLPTSPAEWSGEQFKGQIKSLCDSSLRLLKPFYNQPITDFKEVIKIESDTKVFYPTLRDFLFSRAAAITDGGDSYVMSALALSRPGSPEWAQWKGRTLSDAADFMKAYKDYPAGDCGGYLLWRAASAMGSDEWSQQKEECLGLVKKFLAASSASPAVVEALKNQEAIMTKPYANYQIPGLVAVGQRVAIPYTYGYTSRVGITVKRYPNQLSLTAKSLVVVETVSLATDPAVSHKTDTLYINIKTPGSYCLEPICDGATRKGSRSNGTNIVATPWMPFIFQVGDKSQVAVTDFVSGAPAKGVKASFRDMDKKTFTAAGLSDADGLIGVSGLPVRKYRNMPLQLSSKDKGTVYYGYDVALGYWGHNKYDDYITGTVMVSRPVYHLGDSVGWAAVLVKKNNEGEGRSTLVKDASVEAILYDANYTPVDTLTAVTDRYGRASGTFALPSDRLAGRYSIMVKHGDWTVTNGFMVSDFKLPVFEVKDLSVSRRDSVYVLTGSALRYSGASVPGADVKVDVCEGYYYSWWRPSFNEVKTSVSGTTEADGTFTIDIPATAIANDRIYECRATVTSQSADIAQGSTTFRTGKPYQITGAIGKEYIDLDKPVKLNIFASGNDLKPVALDARWSLLGKDGKAVAAGTCRIDSLGLHADMSAAPAGAFSLSVAPADTALANAQTFGRIFTYSIRRNLVPDGCGIILPEESFSLARGEKKEALVGVSRETWLYAAFIGDGGAPEVKLHHLKKGFNKVALQLGSEKERKIDFYCVDNGIVSNAGITLRLAEPSKKLTLKGESWRDKLTPGAPEQWRLKLSGATGTSSGALVATMYNAALGAFAKLSWPSDLQSILTAGVSKPYLSVSYASSYTHALYLSKPIAEISLSPEAPKWMFSPETARVYYSAGMMRATSTKLEGKLMAVNEMKAEASVEEVEEEVAADAAAPAEGAMAKTAGSSEPDEADNFQYRPGETLQAFWMPSVTIDDNGEAVLNFVTPNAIGAWSFHAQAWTDDCRAALMAATLTASKPVMVEPSLPRFLRRGDKATVLATVINNTDSPAEITTTVERFDPTTMVTIDSILITSSLEPHSQATVPFSLSATDCGSSIGYRVRSTNGTFADGEQDYIPVLDAVTTAIDSEVFYLTDSTPIFTATIPADLSGKGTVALQYCQNPVWDAVKALPGLYDYEPRTACGAASSAYAALTARGLLSKMPEIKQVLDLWLANPADSSLVSRLFKNEDIKLAMLAQTPFVGAANANSEQMQRLALTFNEKTIGQILKTSISRLAALQRADGGFTWGDWADESSSWVTQRVLYTLGRTLDKQLITNNQKLKTIIDRAFRYVDAHVEKDDYSYAALYSLYPSREPSTLPGRNCISRVKQQVIASWKKSPTARKASDALMLHNLGSTNVARQIMGSVKQFASPRGNKGITFPSVNSVNSYSTLLEAFATIMPDDTALIDGMRQWLILRTQATDDLGAYDPTTLVAALLSTGTRWTAIPTGATAAVTIDGSPVELDKIERATGSFSMRLDPSTSPRKAVFTKAAGSPVAYGSVVTVGSQPLASVKAASVDGLSLSRRLLVERDGKWVETTSFRLGERVKVQILIKNSRDMEYVTVSDDRAACLAPVDQMPGWTADAGSTRAYRETGDQATRLFINYLPKGTWYYTLEMTAATAGTFTSGTATIQSQYAPELTARSAASIIVVK